jgi:hypothetical protein
MPEITFNPDKFNFHSFSSVKPGYQAELAG